MRSKLVVGAATMALVASMAATPASAQATIGADAALFSSYVWRGVTYTNKPVLQPDLYVSFPIGGPAALTVGGWANIDLGKYDGSDDISESGGTSAFNFAEFDPWAEVAISAAKVTITPGITAYYYPNDLGLTKVSNTWEVYTKLAVDFPILSPKLNVYYDIDKVKGAYIEGAVSHDIKLGVTALTLGALAGWTGGQEIDSDKSNNFDTSGITHVDLSAAIPFSAGSLTIAPSVHGVFGQDPRTKFTSLTNKSDFKVWGGVTISWSHGGASDEAAE
jgi:hypothetical protein